MTSPRVWIVSELYYPEETSTGHVLTMLAEGLAAHFRVAVICAQPTYSSRGRRAPWSESVRGVQVHRVWSTTLDKDRVPGRLTNMVTFSLSGLSCALRALGPGDRVVVVTNPVTLPFVILGACRARRARCVLLAHDVYPEAMVAAGVLPAGSLTARVLARVHGSLYASMDSVAVIGRDMAELVRRRGADAARVHVVPNWAEVDVVRPTPRASNRLLAQLGLLDRFVVQYAGNMGRVQDMECLVEAAHMLRQDRRIHFLFIGSGSKKPWLEREAEVRGLTNVTVLGPRPRSESLEFLNACDVSIMALRAGMEGAGVPSRLYNVLAAGKPVIAAMDASSEVGRVVREDEVGWVVPTSSARAVCEAVREASSRRDELLSRSKRAREVAERKYSFERILERWVALLREV